MRRPVLPSLSIGMHDTAPGSTLGNYYIDRLLGEGGMGRVYAGTELASGRRVAIKVIAEEHARDPELIGRFYAEAHAASRIRHPSIIEVLDLVYLPFDDKCSESVARALQAPSGGDRQPR